MSLTTLYVDYLAARGNLQHLRKQLGEASEILEALVAANEIDDPVLRPLGTLNAVRRARRFLEGQSV